MAGPGLTAGRTCWGYEYLIITDPTFRPAADALRAWKVNRGISTRVIETGNDAGDAGSTNVAIRNTVRSYYNNCVVRPSYLLLLGDAEHIAPFYRSTLYNDLAGTDLDYSLMTPGDLMPDLAYGRIPVDTLADAQLVVEKIIDYEQMPPVGAGFYDNATMASYFQCCRPDVVQDGTTSRSFIETSELVRNHLLSRGYGVQRIYDTSTGYHNDPAESSYYNSAVRSTVPNRYYNGALLPADLRAGSGFAWDGDGNDVVDAFNDGRFLIIHRDHGGVSGWGSPGFGTGSINSLTNGARTPVVYSINCASGLFDNETRNPVNDYYTYSTNMNGVYFAERLLRHGDGGAVGIIGDTRNSPTWANSALLRGLVDATWPGLLPTYGGNSSIRRLGDILNYGKLYMVGQVGIAQTAGSVSSNEASTNVILYHVFGDPTLRMWTSYPYQVTFPLDFDLVNVMPGWWNVQYEGEGSVITALQDGNPIGRGTVVNGVAQVRLLGDGSVRDVRRPVQLVASHPDGLSVVLSRRLVEGGVGAGGGSLRDPETGFRIDFPENAVGDPITLHYRPEELPAGPLSEAETGVRFFELNAFNADGSVRTQFARPWTMELSYEEDELHGVDEATLQCRFYEDGVWVPIPSTVDAAGNKVICQADHFTRWTLAGSTPAVGQASSFLFLPTVSR